MILKTQAKLHFIAFNNKVLDFLNVVNYPKAHFLSTVDNYSTQSRERQCLIDFNIKLSTCLTTNTTPTNTNKETNWD